MEAFAIGLARMVDSLGWTLLHFLWQGALIGAFYGVARAAIGPEGARARYALGLLALAALALCPPLTWVWLLAAPAALPAATGAGIALTAEPALAEPADWLARLDPVLPWLVALWLCGVGGIGASALMHWHRLGRLTLHGAEPLPQWEACLTQLCRRFGVARRVRLLCSAQVDTPTLIGWLKPVILLPASVALGFSPQQIELILAHELGHIRRADYLVNLAQVVLETVLFYHPVVHWISREVRNEREHCCDDMVLRVAGGDPLAYAHALAGLEELRAAPAAPALAASGGVLLGRIRRIVGVAPAPLVPPHPLRSLLLGALVATTALAMQLTRQGPVELLNQLPAPTARTLGVLLTHGAPLALQQSAIAPVRFRAPLRVPRLTLVEAESMESVRDAAQPGPAAQSATAREQVAPTIEPMPAAVVMPLAAQERIATPAPPRAAAMPTAVRTVPPNYPAQALQRGIEGSVQLEFAVDSAGAVHALQVLSATPAGVFEDAARRALKQWRFPVAAATGQRYTQKFEFSLHPARESAGPGTCHLPTGSRICRPVGAEDIAAERRPQTPDAG